MFITNNFGELKRINARSYVKLDNEVPVLLKPKKIKAEIGDLILIRPSEFAKRNKYGNHKHSDPTDDNSDAIFAIIIDIAPYGGNGGYSVFPNGKEYREQEPIYRCKLKEKHNFYMSGVVTDDVMVYSNEFKVVN